MPFSYFHLKIKNKKMCVVEITPEYMHYPWYLDPTKLRNIHFCLSKFLSTIHKQNIGWKLLHKFFKWWNLKFWFTPAHNQYFTLQKSSKLSKIWYTLNKIVLHNQNVGIQSFFNFTVELLNFDTFYKIHPTNSKPRFLRYVKLEEDCVSLILLHPVEKRDVKCQLWVQQTLLKWKQS